MAGAAEFLGGATRMTLRHGPLWSMVPLIRLLAGLSAHVLRMSELAGGVQLTQPGAGLLPG